jgi:hypothetical protein
MNSTNDRTESVAKTAIPNLNPAEHVAKMAEVQKEIFEVIAQMNQQWFSRAMANANLASELGTKLTGARSFPDAAEAYQQWMAKRMKLVAEDSQQFVADGQKFMEITARLLSKGWSGGST